jgi:hypothetical protein
VSEVNSVTIVIAVDGENYTLQAGDYRNSACQNLMGRACSRWKPKAGAYYPATITDQPNYIPSCLKTPAGWVHNYLHKELPANREVCIGFGKMKLEELRFGTVHKSEFTVCYDVPAVTQRPTDKHGRSAPTPTYYISNGLAYCGDWMLNNDGEWESHVNVCSQD